METSIQGNLIDTNLSMLLAMIRSSSKTGILKLKYPDPRYNTNYTFFEGMAGQVQTLFAAKISSIMRGYGVPEEVLEHLRAQKRNGTGSKLMITLEDGNQALSSDLIAQAFKRRMLMSLVPILQRTDGHFKLNLHKRVTLTTKKGVDPDSMSLEVSRRLDELMHYKKDITRLGPDDVFVVEEGKLGLSIHMQKTLSTYEIKLISVLSEPITLLRALVKARLSWDELLKTIATLQEKEIIKHVFSNSKLIASKLKKGKQQEQIDEFATIFDEDIVANGHPPVGGNIDLKTAVRGLFRNPFK